MISLSGIGGQERSIWSVTPFSCLERTSLTHLLKERTQTRIAIAHFVDECRLIGIVCRGDKHILMLWDTSNDTPTNSIRPLGLVLETGPRHVPFSGLSVPRYNMNHELPFRENRSMGIVVFRICNPSHELTFIEIYAIPVGTLAKFPPVGKLEWSKWQCFATLAGVRPPGPPRLSHILHSWALNVHIPHGSRRSEVILQVYDFSLRSRRRKARDDPSAPFPSYTVQEFPLNPNYRTSSLEFTDSGILVTLVRIYVITRHIEALTLYTSSLVRGVKQRNDSSGQFSATYYDFTLLLPVTFSSNYIR